MFANIREHLLMPYTSNPHASRARMNARNDVVWRGLSHHQAALKYGVNRSTVWRWVKRAKDLSINGNSLIDTLPSRPKHHPREIAPEIVNRIVGLRHELKRCAPVIHKHLELEDISVSLSSVERVLRRYKLTRCKKQATMYKSVYRRPEAKLPGNLVQMDTLHIQRGDGSRYYVYTLIDLYSRLAYAEYHPKLGQKISLGIIKRAQTYLGFSFSMLQTDHGPEFKDGLTFMLGKKDIKLRHSRIRTPNDNAHIERFNRTIQEECFLGRQPNEKTIKKDLQEYIHFYNNNRLHLSLNLMTPTQFVAKVLT